MFKSEGPEGPEDSNQTPLLQDDVFLAPNSASSAQALENFEKKYSELLIRDIRPVFINGYNQPANIAYANLLMTESLFRVQNLAEIEQMVLSEIYLMGFELNKSHKGITYEIYEGDPDLNDILLAKKYLELKNLTTNELERWLLEISIDIETWDFLRFQLLEKI